MITRIMNINDAMAEGTLTSFKHPSVLPPTVDSMHKVTFYRGPIPATNSRPDNAINFYMNAKYKGQRVLQPTVSNTI